MAISIDWAARVISVPQADLTLVQSPNTYELNLNTFRLALKALEASEDGMPELDTHRHSTEVVVSGTTLARTIEIINGYTVTFEDGQYAVNLVGANSNVAEVTNINQVSLRSANSAGLQVVTFGSGLTDAQNTELFAIRTVVPSSTWNELLASHISAGTVADALADAAKAALLPSAAETADAVQDSIFEESTSNRTTAGSMGKAIGDAGTAVGNFPPSGYTLSQRAESRLSVSQHTARNVMVYMTQSSDHYTPATGMTGATVNVCKNGSPWAPASPAISISEAGGGWYSLSLLASHTDTVGELGLQIDATGVDRSYRFLEIKVEPDKVQGQIVAEPGTTVAVTNLGGSDNQFWKDSFIHFTTGVLAGQVRLVTGFNKSSKALTFEATTQPPSVGDRFVLVNV